MVGGHVKRFNSYLILKYNLHWANNLGFARIRFKIWERLTSLGCFRDMWCDMEILHYFNTKYWFFAKCQLGTFVKKSWFFRKCCFSERKTSSLLEWLVFKWKSWLSAFQNTKKLWNRCIITDFRWNCKWWTLFLHVHAYIAVHPSMYKQYSQCVPNIRVHM